MEFLSIDHINGGGNRHREKVGSAKVYAWLKKRGYPKGYQVLCHNCNQAIGLYGKCPHSGFSLAKEIADLQTHYPHRKPDITRERNPASKLTMRIARLIREQYASGNCTQYELADKHNVSQRSVNLVLRNLTWREAA